MSFGNIDVRHHLCRLNIDPRDMWIDWFRFGDSLPFEVEYSTPWPIEFEGRRLPKTGYYRGEPFCGSREDRVIQLERIIDTSLIYCKLISFKSYSLFVKLKCNLIIFFKFLKYSGILLYLLPFETRIISSSPSFSIHEIK